MLGERSYDAYRVGVCFYILLLEIHCAKNSIKLTKRKTRPIIVQNREKITHSESHFFSQVWLQNLNLRHGHFCSIYIATQQSFVALAPFAKKINQ